MFSLFLCALQALLHIYIYIYSKVRFVSTVIFQTLAFLFSLWEKWLHETFEIPLDNKYAHARVFTRSFCHS